MELNGFSRAIIAPLDNSGKFITVDEFKKYGKYASKGIFQVDIETSKGTTQGNITGLNPTVTKVYGSNTVAEVETGVENPSVTLGANDLPFEISSLIQGLVRDEEHGGYKRADKTLFHGALILISSSHNHDAYYSFPYGTFTAGSGVNMQTDAASPVTVHDSVTFSPQARPKDNLLYQINVDDKNVDPNFKGEEALLDYIIDGLSAPTTKTTPSPSPVDPQSETPVSTEA